MSAGPYQIPTLAQVHAEHHHITSPPSLSPTYPRLPHLPLPSSLDNSPGENPSSNCPYPLDGSNERIARLRTELQGVRTGIQRIVSGLHDLNETTHQQELAAQASSLPSFTMSTRSERSPPQGSRSVFQGNLDASAWSANVPSPPRFHNPSTVRNLPRLDTVRPRPSGQDPMLRIRQRAYLESDQQRQTGPTNSAGDITTRNTHRRAGHENPFQTLGSREEIERPDYQSPVTNTYGHAWGEYRNAEAARHSQNAGASNGTSAAESRQTMIANPLINPPAMPQYTSTYFATPGPNGPQPYLNPISLQGITTPDLTPPVRHPQRENSAAPPPRWSYHHMASAASSRRQQNLSAPDRAGGSSESTSSIRRPSDASRSTAQRGESEGGAFGRALELSGVDVMAARTGYPYLLPGNLSRDHYVREYLARETGSESESEPFLTFDTQDRPPPMEPESMMLDMACSICKEHLIDTVVLPCGHAVMCNWCADLHVPSRKHDKSTPRDRSVKCPMCRTKIKQKVRLTFPRSHPFTNANSSKSFIHKSSTGLCFECSPCYNTRKVVQTSGERPAFPGGQRKEQILSLPAIWSRDYGRLRVAKLTI